MIQNVVATIDAITNCFNTCRELQIFFYLHFKKYVYVASYIYSTSPCMYIRMYVTCLVQHSSYIDLCDYELASYIRITFVYTAEAVA